RCQEEAERGDRPRKALDGRREYEGRPDAEPRTYAAGERRAEDAREPADREDPSRAVRSQGEYAIRDEQERGADGHVPDIRDHHADRERDERGVTAPENEARTDIADRVRPSEPRRGIRGGGDAHPARRRG